MGEGRVGSGPSLGTEALPLVCLGWLRCSQGRDWGDLSSPHTWCHLVCDRETQMSTWSSGKTRSWVSIPVLLLNP